MMQQQSQEKQQVEHLAQEDASKMNCNNENNIDSALLSAMRDNRERMNLLKLERTLLDFMRDTSSTVMELNCQRYTSFHRLVLHRLADRFHIIREIPAGMTMVIRVIKTEQSAIPSQLLIDLDPSAYRMPVSQNVDPHAHDSNTPSSSNDGSLHVVGSGVLNNEYDRGGGISLITDSMSGINLRGGSNTGAVVQDVSGGAPVGGKKKMMIMKRGKGSSGSLNGKNQRKSKRSSKNRKNLSDKEKAYEEARARIFGVEVGSLAGVEGEGSGEIVSPPSNCSSALSSTAPSPKSYSPPLEATSAAATLIQPSSETTTPRSKGKGSGANNNNSKVTWRNRKEEEADPDFRRQAAVPMYTTSFATNVGYVPGSGDVEPYAVLQPAPHPHPQHYYGHMANTSPNMYTYGAASNPPVHYPSYQQPGSAATTFYQTNASTSDGRGYTVNTNRSYASTTPQDSYQEEGKNANGETGIIYSQEEFPALKS